MLIIHPIPDFNYFRFKEKKKKIPLICCDHKVSVEENSETLLAHGPGNEELQMTCKNQGNCGWMLFESNQLGCIFMAIYWKNYFL